MFTEYQNLIIFVAIVFGSVVAIYRPLWGFVIGVFLVCSINFEQANGTRTFFGPYFNGLDAIVLLMMIALGVKLLTQRQPIYMPTALIVVIVAWLIGVLVSYFEIGLTYEVLRAARWALSLPIALLIAANFVTNDSIAKVTFWVIFLGTVVGASQHVLSAIFAGPDLPQSILRGTGFLQIATPYFLVYLTVINVPTWMTGKTRLIWLMGAFIMSVSFFLNLTRSLWIAAALVSLLLLMWFRHMGPLLRICAMLLAILMVSSLLSLASVLPFDIGTLATERVNTLMSDDERYVTTHTRLSAVDVELQAWLDGNWLYGNGLGYFYGNRWRLMYGTSTEVVAWGHIGYLTYLAQLGLVGLLAYGLILPLDGAFRSRTLFMRSPSTPTGSLALLALACVCVNGVTFVMSSSYLQVTAVIPGLLLGAAYGLWHSMRQSEATISVQDRKAHIEKLTVGRLPNRTGNGEKDYTY